jgi:hypothetical protein
MNSIQNLLDINGINTKRIKELINLKTFTCKDIEELEGIVNELIPYISFLKYLFTNPLIPFDNIIFDSHEDSKEEN